MLCTHVDDLLCVGKQASLDRFALDFKKVYDCNVQVGHKHSYLGLDIVQVPSTKTVSIGQTGYRKEVLNRFRHLLENSKCDGRTPCNESIYVCSDECDVSGKIHTS